MGRVMKLKTTELYYQIGKVVADSAHCQDCAVQALMLNIANIITQMPQDVADRLMKATLQALPLSVKNMKQEIHDGDAKIMYSPKPETKH